MLGKTVFLLVLILSLALSSNSTAFAANGSCPSGFTLEMAMHHEDHEHLHQHVGTSADQNGDGYICMKPVTPGSTIHVHVDNSLPLSVDD
jgi:hypothetical protein